MTFAEFDHPNTVATTALAKESFTPGGGGGWEVRFSRIRWKNAKHRVAWMWSHVSLEEIFFFFCFVFFFVLFFVFFGDFL